MTTKLFVSKSCLFKAFPWAEPRRPRRQRQIWSAGDTLEILEVPGAVVVQFRAKAPGKTETTGKRGGNAGETLGKTPRDVLRLLRDQPGLSAPQLAERIGKSRSAIERAVKKLREAGLLVRIGPDKGGSWRVIE